MTWYSRSLDDHDTHRGTLSRGRVDAACGIRFAPYRFGRHDPALPGEPADPDQICTQCYLVEQRSPRTPPIADPDDPRWADQDRYVGDPTGQDRIQVRRYGGVGVGIALSLSLSVLLLCAAGVVLGFLSPAAVLATLALAAGLAVTVLVRLAIYAADRRERR